MRHMKIEFNKPSRNEHESQKQFSKVKKGKMWDIRKEVKTQAIKITHFKLQNGAHEAKLIKD